MQFVIEDDENRRRDSIGRLSGIFALTNTFKRPPSIKQNETNKVRSLTFEQLLVAART